MSAETNRTMSNCQSKKKETKLPTKWVQDNIKVTSYKFFTIDPECGGITILRNAGNYFPQKTMPPL
jgi:hypothetical protein